MIDSVRSTLPDLLRAYGTRVLMVGATEFNGDGGYEALFLEAVPRLHCNEVEKNRISEAIRQLNFSKTAGAQIRSPNPNRHAGSSRAVYAALHYLAHAYNSHVPPEHQIDLTDPARMREEVEKLLIGIFGVLPGTGTKIEGPE